MPPNEIQIEPGTIKLVVGKEITTSHLNLKETSTLKQNVFDNMDKMIRDNQ
jgi:hypothetical protein